MCLKKYTRFNLRNTIATSMTILIFLSGTALAQDENVDYSLNDSLFKKMTVEDLIQIRQHFNSKVGNLREEEEESLSRGMELSESFLGERGANIKDRDKVYIRVAEYYIIEAYENYGKAQDDYEEIYLEYEKQYDLYASGQLESEPVQPEFPRLDYSKAIAIYDRILEEYPSSDYADDALYSRAWLLERMDQGVESRRIYQEVIDKYPDSPFAPESYIQLAEYYFAPRDDKLEEEQIVVELQKAIQLYKKVLKYKDSPRYDEALYKLGWSYYKLASRDPKHYNDAIVYFMAVADDIERAKQMDPKNKISNPNVRDEAIEYVGISFTDEAYTLQGVDKARRMIERLGDRKYGPEVMRAIGTTYQKIDEQEKAIYAFENLLEMYPAFPESPAMKQQIVDALYALGRDQDAYVNRIELYQDYGPKSEWYATLENSEADDKIKHVNTAYDLSEAALRTNLSLDLEHAQELESDGQPATEAYQAFASNCQIYLDQFPADSNAYDINWSYAFVLDSKLGQMDKAYEEYIRVSNDYLENSHQHDAALNAVSVADTLVVMKYGQSDTASFNLADIAKLSPEALTPEETRLIEAYDNYIRLFPAGEYTPNFLAAAGGIYYNHKKFAEAKVYFQTLVKRFPGAEQRSLALRSIMDSYFALGKFKDSEIIAKRIMSDQNIPDDQREFAGKRLAAAIFKNAEYLEEQGDYFAAANEFYRVFEETPTDAQFVEPALFNSGRNFQLAKDWVRAIETFDTLATAYPQSKFAITALENAADGYKELEQYSNAGETYKKIFDTYPDSKNAETALYNSGYYYKKGQDWQKAIDANNVYIATYPSQPFAIDLFFSNADLFLKLDNVTEANRIYEQFAQRYPDDPRTVTAFYERGKYYMDNGMDDRAKQEFNLAIQRSENFRREGKDPNAFIAGEAVNSLAEILHKEFLSIELRQPPSNIASQKVRLSGTLTELNKTYSKVLTFGSPRSFEATYNIARGYEEFANIYADQEINSNLTQDKQFVEKKRINEESAQLYEKAVEQYREAVTNIPVIAERLGVDMDAEPRLAQVAADSLADSTSIARAAEIDSTQMLAKKWYKRGQNKISELLYTMAELTSENVYQAININPPGTNPLQNLIYKFTVLEKVATPAIQQTIESHIHNIEQAEQMGLSNKYVEESKRQILLTSNIKGEEVEHLAYDALDQYRRIRDEVEVLVEREFEATNSQGLDYYALDNLASQMIDYSKELGKNVMNSYSNTLQLAEENNIQNDLIRSTQDRMLRFCIEFSDQLSHLADSAKTRMEYFTVRFDSTENYNYDDATGFFDNYYFNLNDYSREILHLAFEAKETYDIKNLWANKLLLKLIKIDPLAYSESIEKDVVQILTDDTWKATTTYYEGVWPGLSFDDSDWEYADVIASYENQFSEFQVNPNAIWLLPKQPSTQFSDTTASLMDSTISDSVGLVQSDSLMDSSMPDSSMAFAAEEVSTNADTVVFFRKTIELAGTPVSGVMYVTADNDFRIYLNGEYLLDDELDNFAVIDTLDYYTFDVFLNKGTNVLGIDVEDKDLSRFGLKMYGYIEVLPDDITAAAEEKAKVKKVIVDPEVLKRVNVLNKNRISL